MCHVLHLPSCTSGRHDAQLCRLHRLPPVYLVPPLDRLLVYGGLSTFTLVTLPVKHLWNRMSGLGGWLSQSSFLLMKCFLSPCGPLEEVSLAWLDPSLASPPDGEYFQSRYFLERRCCCGSSSSSRVKRSFMSQKHGLTWHSEGQAIIRVAGFGGHKEVTKDAHCDEEGEQDHGCNGQTNQSAEAGGEEGREEKERKGKRNGKRAKGI